MEVTQGIIAVIGTVLAGLLTVALIELGRTFFENSQIISRRQTRRARATILSISKSHTLLGALCYAASAAVVAGWLMLVGPILADALGS